MKYIFLLLSLFIPLLLSNDFAAAELADKKLLTLLKHRDLLI